jgi:outer membrane protein
MLNRSVCGQPMFGQHMTRAFLRLFLAIAVTFTIPALAQTSSASTPSGAAPAADPLPTVPSATSKPAAAGTGVKIGAININGAIFGSNEGQRDLEALSKKFEPKETELKGQNDELEALKKQLNTQGPNLNENALADLKKQIEGKQKTFDRAMQDAQEDFQNQQQDIATKILQKMAPLIVKYSQENGFGMIVDTSKPWPQSDILWWNPDTVDITKPVVDAYNVQSGVPAPPPPPSGTAKPAAPKPQGPGAGIAKPSNPPSAPQKQ